MTNITNKISLKTFYKVEKELGINVIDLLSKENKSATDYFHLAYAILLNKGKVKNFTEFEGLDDNIIDEAIQNAQTNPPEAA